MSLAEREASTLTSLRTATRDRTWWLLIVIAPVVWLALATFGPGVTATRPPLSVFIYGVLLYPLLEEFVFRGLLHASLLQIDVMRQRIGPLSLANAITSVLFAISHLISQSPLQAASVFLPSLAFGYVFERYGHVAPAILLHAFYNAGFLWLFAR